MNENENIGFIVLALGGIAASAILFLVLLASPLLGYMFIGVGSTDVAIQFQASRPVAVVGPGVYTDLAPFADIRRINIAELPFAVRDEEVLTKDQQRVGIVVQGTVRRPGMDKANVLLENWARYSIFYTDDRALVGQEKQEGLMHSLARQAMKVCVGDLNFSQAVVGSARDVLRECIDGALDKLASGYVLEIRNVVVPEVMLGKEVQAAMDAITNARFAQQLAQQEEQKAKADAERQLAVEQGRIKVEQGRIQEETRQRTTTAQLTQAQLTAERAVIEQRKANEEYEAQRNLDIARVLRQVSDENAKALVAPELAKASIYEQYGRYTDLQKVLAVAGGWKQTDKVYVVPQGTDPLMVIGNGQTPAIITQR